MKNAKVSLSTLLVACAVVGAGAFAAGRSTSGPSSASIQAEAPHDVPPQPMQEPMEGELPPDHPAFGSSGTEDLPPGHPAVEPTMNGARPEQPSSELSWKVPSEWKVVPNTSTMRLATYRVPHVSGDAVDADVSVMEAGGSVQANVDRWIDQFGPDAKKTAKQSTKKIAGLDVTIVEVEGRYGGMQADMKDGWALLGAIVETPPSSHFFKITGPTRTVRSARAGLDALLASMTMADGGASGKP